MFFVFLDQVTGVKTELWVYEKQATQVLMYCQNDFRRYVSEMLVLKHGRVLLRNINKVVDKLAKQNLEYSKQLYMSQQPSPPFQEPQMQEPSKPSNERPDESEDSSEDSEHHHHHEEEKMVDQHEDPGLAPLTPHSPLKDSEEAHSHTATDSESDMEENE